MRVILNPMARRGAGGRLRPWIERELDRRRVPFDLVQTEGPGHARELARNAVDAGIHGIVAAGGDGTAHDVVNGIMNASANGDAPAGVALGLLPLGTGNDFVKNVPGAGTRQQAIAALAAGRTTPLDVGVCGWDGTSEYFLNAMGTGIDVEVLRRLRRSRVVPGPVSYVSALLRALATYRPMAIELTVAGEVVSRRIMNLAVCNGTSIGGTFLLCPDSRADDRLLDACLISEMSVLRNARMVPRVITGTHVGRHGVTMFRAASMHLRLVDAGPLPFQVDGELRRADDSAAGIHVAVAAARINVIRGP
jgi:diacylglycerol kinase (ATP)